MADELSLTDAVAELATIRLGAGELSDVLGRVADLTRRAAPAAEAVSVTLYQDGRAHTAAFTDDLAREVDERQYEDLAGPCVDAAISGQNVFVDDMAVEDRWPKFTAGAVEHGVLSVLAIALPVQHPAQGGLNLYATRPHAFDEQARETAQTFAGFAAVAVANAHLYADTAALAGQMWEALQSRSVIDQAKGILIRDNACSPDEAFDLLRSASMRSNRKLREIAVAVVENAQRKDGAAG